MLNRIAWTIILTGVFFAASAAAGERLLWYQADFPPHIIVDGPEKTHGIDNQIVQTMIARLPEYEHHFRVAGYPRILMEFKNGKPAVVTPLFRAPEWDRDVHYSNLASYLVLPNGFIYRKGDRDRYSPYLLRNGALDLEALCRSGDFKIGISAGRNYYGIIDEMIRAHRDAGIFSERADRDQLGTLKMVRAKRFDAAIGFPVEIKYDGFEAELGFFRVSKMVPFIPVFIGVPKNPWGLTLVEKLNRILREEGLLDRFAGYYSYWLDDELRPYYETLRSSYYKTK